MNVQCEAYRLGSVCCIWGVVHLAAIAELVVYPAPDGAPYHAGYEVAVREAGSDWREVFVYDAVVGPEGTNHSGFVSFDADFTKPVEVRIRPRRTAFERVRVRPFSSGVEPARDGEVVTLRLTRPAKLSVEFDEDIFHNLLLFANPPEEEPITGPGEGIVYFGPGVHLVGGDGKGAIPFRAGDTVYLAGGALVYGRVDFGRKDDVTIRGRGILCGTRMNHDLKKHRPQMVYAGHARNFRLEGITILDGPCWNMHLHDLNRAVVRNVKIIGWIVNTDGTDPRACQDMLIEDCFYRTSDDCISIKLGNAGDPKSVSQRNRNITVRNCIFWPDKAHALLVGPEGDHTDATERITEQVRFQNIDILRVNEHNPGFYGALAIMASDEQVIRDVVFEDIRVAPIEGGNLIDIRFVDNVYTRDFGRRVEDIVFRNITLRGPNREPNRILGHDGGRTVEHVTIENLVIDGKRVDSAQAAGIETNAFVRGLRFHAGGGR